MTKELMWYQEVNECSKLHDGHSWVYIMGTVFKFKCRRCGVEKR
jgi:hypothetical protein